MKFTNIIRSSRFFIVVGGVTLGGVVLLAVSHAATSYASSEAESGARTGSATLETSSDASGGTYVSFGSTSTSNPTILWGVGDELSDDLTNPLYTQSSVNMATSWFDGPTDMGGNSSNQDMGWMSGYLSPSNTTMNNIYASGKAIELVVWLADDASYAISPTFLTDLHTLVKMHMGNGPSYGPLYVVLFTEFQDYTPPAGYTAASYQAALMQQYINAVPIVHAADPYAKVALGLGGYSWTSGGNADLSTYTAALDASDFTASQEMEDCTDENQMEAQVPASIKQLSSYGKPIMVSHFQLWGSNSSGCGDAPYAQFAATDFTAAQLALYKSEGLFAWDFMQGQGGNDYMDTPGSAVYKTTQAFVNAHAAGPAFP